MSRQHCIKAWIARSCLLLAVPGQFSFKIGKLLHARHGFFRTEPLDMFARAVDIIAQTLAAGLIRGIAFDDPVFQFRAIRRGKSLV